MRDDGADPSPGPGATGTDQGTDWAHVARETALRQLTLGPRTRVQLARAMARKGVPEPVAEQVLDRFAEVDLVDDAAYAQAWVSTRRASRGLSRRALGHELRHRGVEDDVVQEALGAVDAADEMATADDLVARRLRQWGAAALDDRPRSARRLAGMLARKGYGPAVAAVAVRRGLEQLQASLGVEPQEVPGADWDTGPWD